MESEDPTPLSDEATLPGIDPGHADPDTVPSAAPAPERAFEPGARVGRYVLLERLGAGGMGVVYAAYDPHLDRRVALKLLRRESDDSEASRRLLREAQAMARLRHPNVVTVHDVDVVDGRVFIAMEFIEGRTLRQWLNEERPAWPRIVDVFAQAGRGLAAAHGADLIHRDFKPDNAMVDAHGRVAVMDFGIARAAGTSSESGGAASTAPILDSAPLGLGSGSLRSGSLDSGALGDELTLTGAMLGTPAYMSPEQFAGSPTDPRSDQFSWCVALYEALYDSRPFAGDTPAALAFNVLGGKLREPKGRLDVPARVFAVLRRGLATRPEDRYPSMSALLVELEHDTTARWRGRMVPALFFGAVLVLVAFVLGSQQPADAVCTGAAEQLEAVYDPPRREQIRSAFSATQTPYAEHLADTVLGRLDRFAEQWMQVRTEACEATRVRGEQSEALLDRRMRCLDERLDELDSVVAVLREADQSVVLRALDPLQGLGEIELCSDVQWLTARVPPPADPAMRETVSQLQASLARVGTLRLAGRTAEGLTLAREVFGATEDLGYPPIRAVAASRLAMLESADRDIPAALTHFLIAVESAIEGGDDHVAAQAALGLAGALVESPERHEEAERWVAVAEGFWRRRPEDLGVRARILEARARVQRERDQPAEALATLEQAHELLMRAEQPDEHELSVLLAGIAHAQQALGRYDGAVATYQRVLEIDLSTVGENHPDTAATHNNLGAMESLRGRHEQALVHHTKALRIRERLYGEDHLALTSSLDNLSTTLSALGRHEQAEATARRYLELARRHAEDSPRRVATAAGLLGQVLYNAGEIERAAEHYREALVEYERADPDHTSTQIARYNLGEALESLDQPEESMRLHELAYAQLGRALGPEHPYVAYPLAGIARLRLAGGHPREAVEAFEQALAIFDASEGDPREAARARFDLGRALAELGESERAITLARQAREQLDAASSDNRERLAAIDAWLAARESG